MTSRRKKNHEINLDGLNVDLPDLDSLIDLDAEPDSVAIRDRFGVQTFARAIAGGQYVVEGSANLRSCHNIEQFTITRSEGLFGFHREWVEQCLSFAKK